MSQPSHLPNLSPDLQQWLPDGLEKSIPLAVAFFLVVLTVVSLKPSQPHLKHLPVVNPPKSKFQSSMETTRQYLAQSKNLIERGRKLWPNQPFRMFTDQGSVVVLPLSLGQEIRNFKELDFLSFTRKWFHFGIPGFEGITTGMHGDGLLVHVVRKPLTQSLNKVPEGLAEETDHVVHSQFGNSKEWHELDFAKASFQVVSQASDRVFLGEELCRNKEWLRVTTEYGHKSVAQTAKLSVFPKFLRPLVHWFMPGVKELRTLIAEAAALMQPIIDQRRKAKADALAKGKSAPVYNDCIKWAEAEATGPYDPAIFQLTMAFVALHTTSNLLVIHVLRTDGWKKTSLYNMKKLDSVIKEVQRLRPLISMRREVMAPVTLSNGLSLKTGDSLIVDSLSGMRDPNVYENPNEFDPWRFSRWREDPQKERIAQLASTSVNHLGFGLGSHSCVGRFFAANELKVILAHLLVQYEWKPAPTTTKEVIIQGAFQSSPPNMPLLFRRRENPELDIASL
ncbi:cytochrome P450 [Colletotrichum eremochloae]|nr:cytochrome P450 [Colletotrichum eremochloae]